MKTIAIVNHGDRIRPRYSLDEVVADGTIQRGHNAGQPRYRYVSQEAFWYATPQEATAAFEAIRKNGEILVPRILSYGQVHAKP